MTLLDIAEKLNKEHEACRKAEEERARQSELHSRKLSYYNEFGKKWFEDLAITMESLIAQFNTTTGEHSKLKRLVLRISGEDAIAVQFIRPTERPTDQPPTGVLRRNNSELKVTLEIEHAKAPLKDHYDVIVKDFSSLKVRITTVTEKQSLGEGVQWRDRETGKMDYAPTFVTKKIKSTQELNANEFAEYILSTLAEKIL